MHIWKLSNLLTHPEDSAWEALVSQELGSGVHPNRKQGFLLSREALHLCFESIGESISIKNLTLDQYDRLKILPQFTVSLSHTPHWGAALVGDRKTYRSLGIDIEPQERPVKTKIFERISHPEDIKLKPIEVWTLKEAAFKAVMNTRSFSKNIEFSSLRISEGTWFYSSEFQGEWKLEHIDGLVVGIATLKT